MSTVLTKPVLLDETGQAIVGKLDEIKEAIDNGGTEKYPVLIHITTMPTKISYIAGEQLNLAGMVVKAVFSNNVEYDVTDQCTFSPANGTVLTSSDTSVTATYTWHPTGTSFTATQAITVKGIVGISVATPPTKTDYIINETLDLTGMVVHLDYDDNTYDDITADCTYVPANGATLDDDALTAVAISYSTPIGTTLTTSQAISVVIPIYGVEWDGTNTNVLSRTDGAVNFVDPVPAVNNGNGSSPFDDIMPWAGMEPVEDATAGKLVKIPKFWYKWSQSEGKTKLQISSAPIEGFHVSPGHADLGDGEKDYIYVGAYHTASNNKSASGLNIQNGTINALRSAANQLGSGYYIMDYPTWATIQMLYLVEFANWKASTKIGYGYQTSSTTVQNGGCDSMIYHTGTAAASINSYGAVRYRYMENLWCGFFDFLEGIHIATENGKKILYQCDNRLYYSYLDSPSPSSNLITRVGEWGATNPTRKDIKSWHLPADDKYNYCLMPDVLDAINTWAYTGSSIYNQSYGTGYYAAGGTSFNGEFGNIFSYYNIQGPTQDSTKLAYRILKV